TYDELVNGRGLTAEQAAQRVVESRDPQRRKTADQLDPLWDELMKDTATTDPFFRVHDVVNAIEGAATAGVTPAQEQALLGDYLEAAERAFKGPAQGDPELARRLALDEMRGLYGVSHVSGQAALMKYPPEL